MSGGGGHARLRAVGGAAVTVACLALALRNVSLAELGHTLARVNYWWLLPAAAGYLLSLTAKTCRWRAILQTEARATELFWAQAIGLLGTNLFPLRAGEAARVWVASQRTGLPLARVATSVLIEAMLDVALVLALLAGLLPFVAVPPLVAAAGLALAVVLAGASAAGLLLLAGGDRATQALAALTRPAPARLRRSLLAVERELRAGLRGVTSGGGLSRVLGWSALMWLGAVAAIRAVIEVVAPGAAPVEPLFAVAAVSLGIAIPSSPGNVGVYQLVTQQALLQPFPDRYTASSALSVALLAHGLYYALTCVLGAVGLLRLGLSLQTIRTVRSAPASEAVPAEHLAPRPVIGE